MKSRRAGSSQPPRSIVPVAAEGTPTLPPWKAFAVQFSRESGATSGRFAGRVEHLNSGRRARFVSAEELVAVLQRLLQDIQEPTL